MPRPCSSELRARVLGACDERAPPGAVAVRFQVARACVSLWLKQARDAGRTDPRRLGRTRKKEDPARR